MKVSLCSILPLLGLATATPHWRGPGAGDVRSPCPLLNSLANHGILPHDGKDITRPVLVDALTTSLNLNASFANMLFETAILANPDKDAHSFSLDHLLRHNLLEHDASLSRPDAYFTTNQAFDQAIFDQTLSYWTSPILTPAMLANSKIARQLASKASNPTYTYPQSTEDTSLIELANLVLAFGDIEHGTVRRDWVVDFFRNERLPTELGWKRKEEAVTLEDAVRVSGMIGEAAKLTTGSGESESGSDAESASASGKEKDKGKGHKHRVHIHAGLGF